MNKMLIVIDMQNDFIYDALENNEGKMIVENVKNKIKKYKENKDIVVFTKDTHNQDYLKTLEGKKLPVSHCIKGTLGWEIINELKEFENDSVIIEKNTFGYNKWDSLLNELEKTNNIVEIELCGVCTDICVVSNALIIRGARPNTIISVDKSCTAGTTIENYNSALKVMSSCQIDIRG